MFERPTGGDRALLVALDFGDGQVATRLSELTELARSAGAQVLGTISGMVGVGKVSGIPPNCVPTVETGRSQTEPRQT